MSKYKRIQGETFASVKGIIELTRIIARDNPHATKAHAFVRWVDSLGRMPTDDEFQSKCRELGIVLRKQVR